MGSLADFEFNKAPLCDGMVLISEQVRDDFPTRFVEEELQRLLRLAQEEIAPSWDQERQIERLLALFYEEWGFGASQGVYRLSDALWLDKVLVNRQQLATALAIQKALLNHPTAGKLLTHPSRAVEVSYFSIDEETGLEVRVRPDLEIDMGGLRIGADLKTISMWNIKQEGLRAKLHREIIERDYHLSAAMYCETAALDQFFWIFVNKDENYHWIAIIEASEELLELGMLEYRKAMRAIANGFDTGEWPAPITEDYTEELNDFDMRRLEALRVQALGGTVRGNTNFGIGEEH